MGADILLLFRMLANFLITEVEEQEYGEPGQVLKGMRFTFAWISLRRRDNSLASASESLIPLSITYSNVILRALFAPGYVLQASSNCSMGYFLFIGTSLFLISSVTA